MGLIGKISKKKVKKAKKVKIVDENTISYTGDEFKGYSSNSLDLSDKLGNRKQTKYSINVNAADGGVTFVPGTNGKNYRINKLYVSGVNTTGAAVSGYFQVKPFDEPTIYLNLLNNTTINQEFSIDPPVELTAISILNLVGIDLRITLSGWIIE